MCKIMVMKTKIVNVTLRVNKDLELIKAMGNKV